MVPRVAEFVDPVALPSGGEARVKPFAEMSEAELATFDHEFIAALEAGDDSAARTSLAAGFPIYYAEEDTPESSLIKEYPGGRKELVTFVDGIETFLQTL